MTRLKYNYNNTNWGIFPDKMGYVFFPQNMKIHNFFFSQIGNHYTNVPNVIQVFKLKTAYESIEI